MYQLDEQMSVNILLFFLVLRKLFKLELFVTEYCELFCFLLIVLLEFDKVQCTIGIDASFFFIFTELVSHIMKMFFETNEPSISFLLKSYDCYWGPAEVSVSPYFPEHE